MMAVCSLTLARRVEEEIYGGPTSHREKKALGAYYTPPHVASFLVWWAVRGAQDRVLEPSFGGGVFLSAAAHRLADLGGDSRQITGIDSDSEAFTTAQRAFGPRLDLRRADFFSVQAGTLGLYDAVVGNPPFIRYQRFNGELRDRAQQRAAEQGVRLNGLASAWAPFLTHATSFLKTGGRLAMVAPAELCHAAYARPVFRLLCQRFQRVRVLTFLRRLFPHLNEDAVLVLGDGYGHAGDDLRLIPIVDPDVLESTMRNELPDFTGPVVRQDDSVRLVTHLLPQPARELYEQLARNESVVRFGRLATIGIGYVTGNNKFFHLSAADVRRWNIPHTVLRPAVCRAAWLSGLRFQRSNWRALETQGLPAYLLDLHGQSRLSNGVLRYIRSGENLGIDRAYKCRVRAPWYAVPGVSSPDLLLSYMADRRPALVLNQVGAVAPNTFLHVRLRDRRLGLREAVAAGWWTSLSAISAEIEGHSLGGGLLKLEPGEAANVLLPLPSSSKTDIPEMFEDLDALVRSGRRSQALDLADRVILRKGLGLTVRECGLLRDGFHTLVNRRRQR